MRRVRLLADMAAAIQAEDVGTGSDRATRRAFFVESMFAADPGLGAMFMSAFAGPETVPDELVDEGWVDRIRTATLG